MILLIDDSRDGLGFDLVARNAEAGLLALGAMQGNIEELYIDYDLGYSATMNGLDILENALELEILPNIIKIASTLLDGRKVMKEFLESNGYKTEDSVTFLKQLPDQE